MWIARLKDGRIVSENDTKWRDIKDDVANLGMFWHGAEHWLPANGTNYQQAKSASADLGGGAITIDSRWISCTKDGTTLLLRFYEKEATMVAETKER